MPVIEGSQYGYWVAKNPSNVQGTAVGSTLFTTALAVTGGSLSSERSDGQERFPTYGGRFYSAVDWVDSIQGQGELTCAAHPSATATLLKYFLGTEVVGGAAAPYTHTLTAATASLWCAVYKKMGVLEGTGAGLPRRERYNDCRITQLVIEGSSANKMVRVTPTFLAVDPGEIKVASFDPTATVGTDRPFVYTDGSSKFKFSTDTGTAVIQTSTVSFQITLNDTLNPAPGDTITPLGYLPGESTCTVAVTCTADSNSILQYNRLIYGSPTLADTNKPVGTLPATYGSLDIKLDNGAATTANRTLQFLVPSIKWTPTAELPTNTDGSAVELSFTGEARGTTNLLTAVAGTADSAAY